MLDGESLLYGAMLGDGSVGKYSSQYKITITGHSIDDKDFLILGIKPILEKLFKKPIHLNFRKDSSALDLIIYSKEVFEYMTKKWNYPAGRKKNISISKSLVQDKKIMRNVISGFFATDGSMVITNNNGIFYPRVEFGNKSTTILIQIRNFLSQFGIKGGLYISHKHPTGNVYRLQYNGKKNTLKFWKIIGFINPKHKRKFEEFTTEFIGTPR